MTRLSRSSRVLLGACTYVFVAVAVIGGASFAAISLTAGQDAALREQSPSGKIGPGYARMPPINQGKPEKTAAFTPYTRPVANHGVWKQVAPANVAPVAENTGLPLTLAAVSPSSYSPADIHRVY